MALFDDITGAIVYKLQQAIGTPIEGPQNKILNTNFHELKFPTRRGVPLFPACIVYPARRDTITPVTNVSYDQGFGVGVSIIQKNSGGNLTENIDRINEWKEDAIFALADKRLLDSGSTERAYLDQIEPGSNLETGEFLAGFDVAGFTARCFVRRTNK